MPHMGVSHRPKGRPPPPPVSRKSTSDVTPSKLYARFLKACDHTEELQACGTRVTGMYRYPLRAKNEMCLTYQRACKIFMHHPERAARCQELLDAAMEREHVNQDAMRTHAAFLIYKEQEERRKEKARSERLDKLYPPIFEEPPVEEPPVAALTSEEREAALDEIDSFNTTPVLWVGLRSKRRRPADEPPEPCDNCCGVCEYCKE